MNAPELNDILRRLANVVRFGRVHAADYPAARVRVEFGDAADPNDYVITAWLPWLDARAGNDRTWHPPEVGEAVVVFSPGGELTSGVVMAGIFYEDHPAPADRATVHRTIYQDGTVVEHDRAAQTYTVDSKKAVVVKGAASVLVQAGQNVTIEAGDTLTLKAKKLSIVAPERGSSMQGSQSVDGNVDASGTVMDGSGNSNHHSH